MAWEAAAPRCHPRRILHARRRRSTLCAQPLTCRCDTLRTGCVTSTVGRYVRFFRRKGLAATVARGAREAVDYLRIQPTIYSKRRFQSPNDLLLFLFSPEARLIRPSQLPVEFERLLSRVSELAPIRVLEIGTNNGGTLFAWTRVAGERSTIISLDLPGGGFGGGYPAWRRHLYRAFALPFQRLHLIEGDSHAPSSIAAVRKILGAEPLDFLLIDGDHTYDGVKLDFENFAPLVRPGGLIAFHDISEHHDPSCDVRRYWLEVSRGKIATELMASPPEGWAGIGVITK
jgi:hypothetical protein